MSFALGGVAAIAGAPGCSSAPRESSETVAAAVTGIDLQHSVLTQHNDIGRTGAYLAESTLKPDLVRSGRFGRLYTRHVDGQIAAQPLYVSGVSIGEAKKNLLLVATRKNIVYAFDADSTDRSPLGGLVWSTGQLRELRTTGALQRYFTAAEVDGMDSREPNELEDSRNVGNSTTPRRDLCAQTHGAVGITSTPVIDAARGSIYVVARNASQPTYSTSGGNPGWDADYVLYELSLVDGHEVRRTVIDPGDADWDPNKQLNRPALLLVGGKLYIAFGQLVCDDGGGDATNLRRPHGWVIAYDVTSSGGPFTRVASWNSSPQGLSQAGIWMSGEGPSSDGTSIYFQTGNGQANSLTVPSYAESIVALTLSGNTFVSKRFRPQEYRTLDTGRRQGSSPGDPNEPDRAGPFFGGDSDLASGGVLYWGGTLIGGGKQGMLYLVAPSRMTPVVPGKETFGVNQTTADDPGLIQRFQAFHNTWHPEISDPVANPSLPAAEDDLSLSQAYGPNLHGSPVFYVDPNGVGTVFAMPEKDYLRSYQFSRGALDPASMRTSNVRSPDGMPGGVLSLSASGSQNGIVWASVPRYDATVQMTPGDLIAFDASTLTELWRDDDPAEVAFAKFTPPTIAQGKVFRPTYGDEIVVYGVRDSSPAGGCPVDPVDTSATSQLTAKWHLLGADAEVGIRTTAPPNTPPGVTAMQYQRDHWHWNEQAQKYQNDPKVNVIAGSPSTCAHLIREELVGTWKANPWLGAPLADEERTANDRTTLREAFQRFQHGTIYVKRGPAFAVPTILEIPYQANGGPAALGLPVGPSKTFANVISQSFERGFIEVPPTGVARVTRTRVYWTDAQSLPLPDGVVVPSLGSGITDANYELADDSWVLAAQAAALFCQARGYPGGMPSGDHVPDKVGVMCFADGAHLFRTNYSTSAWTIPHLIADATTYSAGVTWPAAGRMAQEMCMRNGLVGGVYQGDEDGHAGIESTDRTIACFDATNAALFQLHPNEIPDLGDFDVAGAPPPWQQAARTATHVCQSKGYVGGRFNGHRGPEPGTGVMLHGLLCYR